LPQLYTMVLYRVRGIFFTKHIVVQNLCYGSAQRLNCHAPHHRQTGSVK